MNIVVDRQAGYYWVNFNNEWIVAYYDRVCKTWHQIGSNKVYYDKEFRFIDTKRLIK